MHTTFTSDYAVWSVHVSRASGVAIYAVEDGSIVHFQLSEKYLISDRARAREPHFMCCKLTESDSHVLSFESVSSDLPLQVKNQRTDNKQAPLTKSFSRKGSGSIPEQDGDIMKTVTRQSGIKSKSCLIEGTEMDEDDLSCDEMDQLALISCDHSNIGNTYKAKSRSLSAKIDIDDNKRYKHGMPYERSVGDSSSMVTGCEIMERHPSKAVAVHRVRWNLNKGFEDLVCFGGAAGIIRCQMIMQRGL
ncbi:hypothetical protein KP509_33G009900 [Ceratopteris richardii]|nr:hypothetical protein KP509_33G009900 [Ceratopteris richardii]